MSGINQPNGEAGKLALALSDPRKPTPTRKGIVRHAVGPLRRLPQHRKAPPPVPVRPGFRMHPRLNPGAAIRPIALPAPRRGDPDILVVEDVARILRCTVDTARRIPRDQLPAYPGPGRHRLYLREDVRAYVRSLGKPALNAELLLAGATAQVLGLPPDRGRERQRRRTS
jgi:hypothetical protein